METQTLPVGTAPARHHSGLLASLVERRRLERMVRLLPLALRTRTPRRVAEVLIDGACLLANARVGWVVRPDLAARAVVGGPMAGAVDPAVQPDGWPVVTLVLAGRAVHVADVWDPAGPGPALVPPDEAGRLGLRSLIALAIGDEDCTTGVLVLAHHRAGAFSPRRIALVEALTEHLGQVLSVCDAAGERSRLAAALQETLLPPVLPGIEGVDAAARYRPCGSGNPVGGDFYDIFADGRGGWFVLLGDACGTGPEAAGLAGVARYTARALAEMAEPAEMLAQVNRALVRATTDDRFCSAVVAHLRPTGTGTPCTVALASAGHPPAFVLRASGAVEIPDMATGLLLGILEEAAVGTHTVTLQPGEALVLYTDGVVESRDRARTRFGEERLASVLADARGRSASGIARRIERAVVDFRSSEQQDDLAVLVIRCRPVPAG